MGYYKIKKGTNGKFHFNLHAGNHQVILSSQMYADKAGAKNGVKSCQTNGSKAANFESKTAKNGQFHFNLLAANKQVIGSSEMYKSTDGCKNGIASVMKNSSSKDVKEEV
jgi:hypothetical protein